MKFKGFKNIFLFTFFFMCKIVVGNSNLNHIDTLELQQIDVIDNKKNIFDFTFLKDVVNTLEENDYEYITIDKKPPKSTSPKEMKYFADCYWYFSTHTLY